jgi:hypothetical protein
MNDMKTDKQPKSWETYEQIARYVLDQIADRFGVDRFEGKQKVLGQRSGTSYEVDAKGVTNNGEVFLVVECRRYTNSRQNQEKIGALAYRIIDTGASGGIIVSPLGLQDGASRIAAAENIHSIIMAEDSTFEQYVVTLLNEVIIRPRPATARVSTGDPIVVITEAKLPKSSS